MSSSSLLTPIITKTEGIRGVIKQKPEDFIVGEISQDFEILDPRVENFKLEGKTGLFTHFVLIKNNIDTSAALDWIAKIWRVPRKNIGIAGSKDKKALTAQRVSVWGIKERLEKGKIQEINTPKIKTKSLCLRLKEMRLGNLWGNFFEISIRDIPLDEATIRSRMMEKFSEIENNATIFNGFGLQRFGDVRPITHLVGEKLLLGDFKAAIREYIGRTYEKETKSAIQSRRIFWETGNIQESLKHLPNYLQIERKLLNGLLRTNNDYEQVFFSLPGQLRKLFIHAYQSYLFNKYLTSRYTKYSKDLLIPIEGEKIVEDEVFAPMVGSKVQLTGKVKEIYENILDDEIISLNDFSKPLSKKLGGTGTLRSIRMRPEKLKLLEVSPDKLNEGKHMARVSFELRRGSYATELLREIMKH
ncbi:MAG: tRNA pseudouridine(13) synthase TruD [Candidatus Heimdallarchaeaceae archaeon]